MNGLTNSAERLTKRGQHSKQAPEREREVQTSLPSTVISRADDGHSNGRNGEAMDHASKMIEAVKTWDSGNIHGFELLSRITKLLISNETERRHAKVEEERLAYLSSNLRKDVFNKPVTTLSVARTEEELQADIKTALDAPDPTKRTLASDLHEDR